MAGILLGGLFALLWFFLLDRGGSATLVETPDVAGREVGVHPGSLARDFEALNLEGEPFRLSDLRGRPVVVNFWATWCTSCLAEMPALEVQRVAHEDEGLAIVAVNVGERAGDARGFIDELELYDFAIALDPDLTVADAYNVRGLPHSVFIDSDGVIEAEYRGQLDDETMARYVEAAIDAVLGGEPPNRLRIVTTVPREHVLEVVPDAEARGRAVFISRRFRCEEDYCGDAIAEQVQGSDGVVGAVGASVGTEPTLVVDFDPTVLTLDDLVSLVADRLREHPDPLYTRDLEVRYAVD